MLAIPKRMVRVSDVKVKCFRSDFEVISKNADLLGRVPFYSKEIIRKNKKIPEEEEEEEEEKEEQEQEQEEQDDDEKKKKK
uniref:Uncharacterized protein n=1 Tax=Vespula pensylvanica TaxID=30213 RepID=A0A834UFH9_VESPE|nr:hypothetical protein H0235_003979 [Vespula pensylvanica]